MASIGGHRGSVMLTRVLDIIDRHAYKQRHVAWNERGVKAGLPPDVVTVMIGLPEEGFWWNLRRGMVPEHNVRTAARVEDNESILEDLGRIQAACPGLEYIPGGGQPGATSMFHPSKLKKTYKGELLYTGWRGMLTNLLMHRKIRENTETETLLGSKAYRSAILSRKRWDAAMAENITAD